MTGSAPPGALCRTAPAVAASVGVLRRAAARHLRDAGIPGAVVGAVELAVSEAVTNVVLHAYPAGAGGGPVHLALELRGGAVLVRVTDEGTGMATRAGCPGAGLGLSIIADLAARAEMSRASRGAGTELLMAFDGAPA